MGRLGKKLAAAAALYVGILSVGILSGNHFSMCMTVYAGEKEKIESGIFADDISLAGMSVSEAKSAIQSYVDSFAGVPVVLHVGEGEDITSTAAELGLKWNNQWIVDEAVMLGKDGNILQCYKALKDLEFENKVYEIAFDFDKNKIRTLIEEQGAQYSQGAVDATLTRVDGVFSVTEGQSGIEVDVNASTDAVYEYLTKEWDGADAAIDLVIVEKEPRGSAEELAMVTDVLGTFTTSYSTSGPSRSANVSNGCNLINGTTLYPGDEFSAYAAVSPFTEANGYYMAGSYLNGQVVDSLGGGICQVSTTLYNAVLKAELNVTERHNHSMIVTYVDPSADAAIAESSGKDFKFVNSLDYPIYIEGYTTPDKQITFTIYGVETRESNRVVSYESVVLERTAPDTEAIFPDASLPLGYCSVQSAHVGCKAELWKVTTVDGVEVSREQVNSSSYNKSPRSATVGVATPDPDAYNAIMAAIGTNSIDEVKAVAAAYKAAADAAAAAAAAAEQPPAPEGAPAPEAPAQ